MPKPQTNKDAKEELTKGLKDGSKITEICSSKESS